MPLDWVTSDVDTDKPYECLECDKKFAKGWEFSQHKRRHLPDEVKNGISERSRDSKISNGHSDHSNIKKVDIFLPRQHSF